MNGAGGQRAGSTAISGECPATTLVSTGGHLLQEARTLVASSNNSSCLILCKCLLDPMHAFKYVSQDKCLLFPMDAFKYSSQGNADPGQSHFKTQKLRLKEVILASISLHSQQCSARPS